MKAKGVIQRLKADGWFGLTGKPTGHKQFKHPIKSGKVTVAMHSCDIALPTLKSSPA